MSADQELLIKVRAILDDPAQRKVLKGSDIQFMERLVAVQERSGKPRLTPRQRNTLQKLLPTA